MKRVLKKIDGAYEHYIQCEVCKKQSYDEISLLRNKNLEKRKQYNKIKTYGHTIK